MPRIDMTRIWMLYAKHWKRLRDIRTPTDLYYNNFTLKATNHLACGVYMWSNIIVFSGLCPFPPLLSKSFILQYNRRAPEFESDCHTHADIVYDLTSQNAIYSPFNMLSPSNHIHSIISIFNHINWMTACLCVRARRSALALSTECYNADSRSFCDSL